MAFDKELQKGIAEIIESLQCSKNFECYKSGFENLCKAKDFGADLFLECLEPSPEKCKFSSDLESFRLCQCPLRVYIAKNLKK